LAGNLSFFGKQILAVAVTAAYSVAGTLVILKVVDALVGLRVTADEEREGLDINLHGEEGYSIGSSTYGHAELATDASGAESELESARGNPVSVS
jgi:ammonia channel protein AmtB